MALPPAFTGLRVSTDAMHAGPGDSVVVRPPPASGPSMTTLAVLGALGVGGYFLYRHFKKG